ncbi:MAG: hypothetical protein ACRDWB_02785, partial [Acidimicrobiales bacterium]
MKTLPDTAPSTAPAEPRVSTPEPSDTNGSGTVDRDAPPGPRQVLPWTRVLYIGLICFAVWLVLDAPSLQKSAQYSPIGTRRTVSLDLVGPIAAFSRGTGLSHVVSWADDIMGRSVGGGPALSVATPPPTPKQTPTGTTIPIIPSATTTPTPTTLPPLPPHPTTANP